MLFVATEENQDEHHNKTDLNGLGENNDGEAVGRENGEAPTRTSQNYGAFLC